MSYSGLVLHGEHVRDHVEQAQEGEHHGFSGGWVTEVSEPDAITVLAATAASTERFGLGTGILPIGLRDPYLAAMSFWSLQDLSGGRVSAGFGVSTPVIVSNWHGLPWDKPVARMREYVDVFRRLTSGERLRHEGLYQTRAPAMDPAEPAIPVYIGALGEKMLELAGEIADGVILNYPTATVIERSVQAIERGIAKAGRKREEVRIVAFLRTVIDESYEQASAPIKNELLAYLMAPVYRKIFIEDGFEEDCEVFERRWLARERTEAIEGISEGFVRAHAVVGQSAEECRELAAELVGAGLDEAFL
ncbi:MAG: LLM class flavin-dependent oxidoreductase, partial [Dehalococcoidia bacterium]|nr:LLM class flavin-dependent oxidoreductase [Dehalococcoidia bacterium]